MEHKTLTDRRYFLKQTVAASASLYATSGAAKAADQSAESRDVGLIAQLFLDDAVIENKEGFQRKLHRPRKTGLIQEANGEPWDRGGLISVVRDPQGSFHMTYHLLYWDPSVRDLDPNIGQDKAHWFRMPIGYAVSDDGIRWKKPKLGKVMGPTGFRPAPESKWKDGQFEEPTGISRDNNLGCPIYSIKDVGQFGGIHDDQRKYLINAIEKDDDHAFAKITDAGLYYAADVPDLKDPQWRKKMEVIWEGPHRGPRGPSVRAAGFDEKTKFWFEVSQSAFGGFQRRGGRDIARWTSQDMLKWSEEELVLPIAEDESRDPRDFVEYMEIAANRISDFWLAFLIVFHGDRTDPRGEMPNQKGIWRKGYTDLRLMMSRDAGKTWQRVGGKEVWVAPHESEHGYDRLLGMPFYPVRVKDELWLYYGCWDGDHLSWNRDGTTYYKDRMRTYRTARATLRWDGYVSLRADDAGTLTTKPLTSKGRRLTLNAEATKGAIRVELQQPDGTPIPGFTLSDCRELSGAGITQPVQWKGGDDLSRILAGRTVRLRFEGRRCDLFGFQFQT